MCAEHSKIIDGPKWADFTVDTLTTWKEEHEQRVANNSDRNWIRPPNSITKLTQEGEHLHFSYWVDRNGRPLLFNSHQLAVLNALMAINSMVLKLGNLPENLESAKSADVATVLQQEWARFQPETSVVADFCTLLAMAGNVTFAEFLGFVVQGNDATSLIQKAAWRIARIASGEPDRLAPNWFKSDLLS